MNHPILHDRTMAPGRACAQRRPLHPRRLRFHDPAVLAMTDFSREPPATVTEDVPLEQALNLMFRLATRALLVVRGSAVAGLVTLEDARAARACSGQRGSPRVGAVMTPTREVPAIDWQTLQDSSVADLIEIFDGAAVLHLVVLENEAANVERVRGVIHRARLERQLRVASATG